MAARMNAYRFDMVIETDIEMSDDLLTEVCLEMREAFLSLLRAKRINGTLNGDVEVSKGYRKNGKYTTYTGTYEGPQ
jgi:hypothetical protein